MAGVASASSSRRACTTSGDGSDPLLVTFRARRHLYIDEDCVDNSSVAPTRKDFAVTSDCQLQWGRYTRDAKIFNTDQIPVGNSPVVGDAVFAARSPVR